MQASVGQNPIRQFVGRFCSAQQLIGDVRSAVIAGVVGSISGILLTWFTIVNPLAFTVVPNQDGFGQPKGLFDLAEKHDPKLKLEFSPAELRSVYVCEFKHVTGPNYTALVMQYLEAYRDCFDVSQAGDNEFKIFANTRSTRLQQQQGTFLCQCDHIPGNR